MSVVGPEVEAAAAAVLAQRMRCASFLLYRASTRAARAAIAVPRRENARPHLPKSAWRICEERWWCKHSLACRCGPCPRAPPLSRRVEHAELVLSD